MFFKSNVRNYCETGCKIEGTHSFDTNNKTNFFGVLEKEVNQYAKRIFHEQTSDIANIFGAWDRKSLPSVS